MDMFQKMIINDEFKIYRQASQVLYNNYACTNRLDDQKLRMFFMLVNKRNFDQIRIKDQNKT